MTDKQEKFLRRYIDEKNISKLKSLDFNCTVSFIDMILKCRNGERIYIPHISKKVLEKSEDERKLEKLVNENKRELGLLQDEYACLKRTLYINPNRKYYVFEQRWFKGMSNSSTIKSVIVDKDGNKFNGFINELVELDIYSAIQLSQHYVEVCQQLMKA